MARYTDEHLTAAQVIAELVAMTKAATYEFVVHTMRDLHALGEPRMQHEIVTHEWTHDEFVHRYSSAARTKPFDHVFSTFTIGLLTLLPAYLVELSFTGPFTIDQTNIAAFLYIGFPLPGGVLLLESRRHHNRNHPPSVIYYLVPVFTALAAWLLLDEPIGAAQVLSMIIVIAGVAVSHQSGARPVRARQASTRARDQ
jgi:hypothetical protein